MPFPSEERLRFISDFETFARPVLGKVPVNQFIRAIKKPSNTFNEIVLRPHLFVANAGKETSMPVAVMKNVPGRNHYLAEHLMNLRDPTEEYVADPFIGLEYFANCLRPWSPDREENGWVIANDPPSGRAELGEHQVFTFEFDINDVDFVKHQLAWARARKGEASAMERLFQFCSQFADFIGITMNYSGHKSFHAHIVFATALAREKLHLDRMNVRRGHIAMWEWLRPHVTDCLAVPAFVAPDDALRQPESYRRIPNGTRVIDFDGHLLGFPKGTFVPQVTIWERYRERAAGDSLPLFFQPDLYRDLARAETIPCRLPPARRVGPDLTDKEREFCETQLRVRYADWPRFEFLTYEGGKWVARFRNSPNDRNPSSVMTEDFNAIRLFGRDAENLSPRTLLFPLGKMIDLWRGAMRKANGSDTDGCPVEEIALTASPPQPKNLFERRFQNAVKCRATAQIEMERFFASVVPTHPKTITSPHSPRTGNGSHFAPNVMAADCS